MVHTDSMIQRVRPVVRLRVRSVRRVFGTLTANRRLRPTWLIVGAQKGGTTSLQAYLGEHPSVALPRIKEINYFNQHYQKPFAWYLGHFPVRPREPADEPLTGEATAQYLSHRHVPQRVADCLPDVRIVVLLRDPVTRAFSHYHHERDRNREALSFEGALDAEASRLTGEEERMTRDPDYYSYPLRHFSYAWRGMYVDQLERWFEHFSREQFLVLQSEALFRDPDFMYQRVLNFLGLSEYHLDGFPKYNARSYPQLREATRERLVKTFAIPNERLFELIGERFDWSPAQAS